MQRLRDDVWVAPLESAVLPVVSEIYSLLRGQNQAGKAAWVPPHSFERCVSLCVSLHPLREVHGG